MDNARPGNLEITAAKVLTGTVKVRFRHASGEVRDYCVEEYCSLPTAAILGGTYVGLVES